MRLSVQQEDPDFNPIALSGAIEVWLDGVMLNDCICADDAVGEAVCFKRSRTGALLQDFETETFKTEVRRGVVEFKLVQERLLPSWRGLTAVQLLAGTSCTPRPSA